MKQDKVQEIGNLLAIMSTHATLRSTLIAQKLGINTTDLECLEVLMRLGKTTAGILAEETKLTTGAVTKMIDRLEKAGFVERSFEKTDRRKVFIILKRDKVLKIVFPLYQSLSEAVSKKLSQYNTAELDVILDFLSSSIDISNQDLKRLA